MNSLTPLGWILVLLGAMLVLLGLLLMLIDKVPWLGRLPGDIVFQRDGVRIYIPLMTSLVLSLLLTLVLWAVQWWCRR